MSTKPKTNIGWWVLISVVLIALPIIIGDEGWMTSWGGYLGAVISSAIAFVILYIQRRDNEKQNEENRQLQLNILIYQQERARLDNLQRMFTVFINLNGFNDLLDIARHIENGHTQEALDSLRVPFDKGANAMAMFSMEFMLVDKESYQVGRYVDWYIKKHSRMLMDINVIVETIKRDRNMSTDYFVNTINKLPQNDVSSELRRVAAQLNGEGEKQSIKLAAKCIRLLVHMRSKEHHNMGDMFNQYLYTQRQKIDSLLIQQNE